MADKVAGLLFKISADTRALRQGFKKTQSQVSGIKKSFAALGPIIAGAFSVRVIGGFTKEVIKLAGEAEGVEEAFSRLENSEQLIKNLTKATQGTVSQLQLMKLAVQAKNFKIPLDKLATYFEFATKRAAQTGESVDYLVNSLITGVGRKSVLVMDNLGISAVALQEEVKRVGDFGLAAGNIIERELGNMGDVSKTTAQEVASLAATWANVKTEIGKAVIENANLNESFGDLNDTISGIDWNKSIDDLISAFQRWYDLVVKTNPVLAPLIAGMKLLKKEVSVLPQKAATPVNYNTERTKIGGSGLRQLNFKPIGFSGAAADAPERVAGSTSGLSKISGLGAGQFDLSGMISGVEQRASQLATTVREKVAPAMVELGVVVQQAFAQAVDAMGNFIEGLFAGTLNLEGGFQKILVAFGGFMVQMGKMIAAYGVALLAMGSMNPVAAIAAGLALVAIGSAIKGLASRGPAAGGATMGASGGGATGGQIGLTGKIQGRDIVLAYDRGSSLTNAVT